MRSPSVRAARRASPAGCCAACAISRRSMPGGSEVTRAIADRALRLLDVDPCGLDQMDRRYLGAIANSFGGGPVGIDTLAAALSEPRDAIEDIIEPYLIQQGFLQRTPRGQNADRAWLPPSGPRGAGARATQQFGLFSEGDD